VPGETQGATVIPGIVATGVPGGSGH
jgi:hypothetical protein